jgi:hypothetical protein
MCDWTSKNEQWLLSQTGKTNKTSVHFDKPFNYIVDYHGAKSVEIKTSGYEKMHVS